jgi:hypothetical protein
MNWGSLILLVAAATASVIDANSTIVLPLVAAAVAALILDAILFMIRLAAGP